jgi:hypothetical protein
MGNPIVVSYGGGTNSTALLCGMYEKNWIPDLILFADTGGEKPHTYEHNERLNKWLTSINFPIVTIVKSKTRDGKEETLEEMLLRTQTLPSVAFGWKTCSQRYKLQPQEKFLNHWEPATIAWRRGEKILKLIGFDADESRRARKIKDDKFEQRYPLIEWGWGRDECIEAIKRIGLPLPGKSACFFCPNSKKQEVLDLKQEYPDLFQRAIEMERNATNGGKLITIKGLGRQKSWEEIVQNESASCIIGADQDCGCYDGE